MNKRQQPDPLSSLIGRAAKASTDRIQKAFELFVVENKALLRPLIFNEILAVVTPEKTKCKSDTIGLYPVQTRLQ